MPPSDTAAATYTAPAAQALARDRQTPPPRLGPWGRAVLPFLHRLEVGRLTLVDPEGRRAVFESEHPGPHGEIHLRDVDCLRRLVAGGTVAFAEAYRDGAWDSPNLTALVELAARHTHALETRFKGRPLARGLNRMMHRLRRNSRTGSRRNIAYHYDLGNGFYRRWLDSSMTYSCALFDRPGQALDEAQAAKHARLAALLDVGPGDHVLEIGCGWGGFAIHLARTHGCRVTGLTLSTEQHAWATRAVREAGLADRVDIRLQDYRDVTGTYDALASIEMFEAVGEEHWPQYFRVCHDRLRPGGRAALQVITIAEDRFDRYRRGTDFIQKHIFPGGMLPSPSRLRDGLTGTGLAVTAEDAVGPHYAETLRRWRAAFQQEWPAIAQEGFDEAFRRLWTYYLCYCEAGFRAGTIDVVQLGLRRPAA
ncbi:Cyclopropane-fatty-acyl-phospholipid synthase, plant type [Caenispirillum salinarum AK4]|uniref:Cyclopropane-fatty-acyl-phospholipid synthase, plant type n=1 Tax=Caenispirillum salinarum AK4 TaxID=1238182 RepID=K9HGJ2_9PROT|nr:cyclopropane-fatty-acyl-phospholipid synthase family protein [Caenispirillum salinarum]EKV29573.1 Cyclopropane-fatty-acyl-phospholipid synthase, plant type [Caenispirillum salinarum AK4]